MISVDCFFLLAVPYLLLFYVVLAIGSTKKRAKKMAAEKMIATLQSLSGCSEITWVRTVFQFLPHRQSLIGNQKNIFKIPTDLNSSLKKNLDSEL